MIGESYARAYITLTKYLSDTPQNRAKRLELVQNVRKQFWSIDTLDINKILQYRFGKNVKKDDFIICSCKQFSSSRAHT